MLSFCINSKKKVNDNLFNIAIQISNFFCAWNCYVIKKHKQFIFIMLLYVFSSCIFCFFITTMPFFVAITNKDFRKDTCWLSQIIMFLMYMKIVLLLPHHYAPILTHHFLAKLTHNARRHHHLLLRKKGMKFFIIFSTSLNKWVFHLSHTIYELYLFYSSIL